MLFYNGLFMLISIRSSPSSLFFSLISPHCHSLPSLQFPALIWYVTPFLYLVLSFLCVQYPPQLLYSFSTLFLSILPSFHIDHFLPNTKKRRGATLQESILLFQIWHNMTQYAMCVRERYSTIVFCSTEAHYIRQHINNTVNTPALPLKLDCCLLYITLHPGLPYHKVPLAILKASNQTIYL